MRNGRCKLPPFIQQLVDQYPKPSGCWKPHRSEHWKVYTDGCKTALDPSLQQLALAQWEVYDPLLLQIQTYRLRSVRALLNWLDRNKRDWLFTQSQILIARDTGSGLRCTGHQFPSTSVYPVVAGCCRGWLQKFRMEKYTSMRCHHFRFLSYGDGSLFIHTKKPGHLIPGHLLHKATKVSYWMVTGVPTECS